MTVSEFIQKDTGRYKTSPDFVLRRISGESVLIPVGDTPMGNSMISVNDTFCFLWDLFSEPITLAEAVARTREAYDGSTGEMESHIVSFVLDCAKYGMISKEEN